MPRPSLSALAHIARRWNIFLIVLVLVGMSGCGRRPISSFPTSTSTPNSDVVVTGGFGTPVPLPPAAPVKLQIQDTSFEVKPVEIQKGLWRYQKGHPDSAQWIYGTLINYVIGLEATPQNTDLLQSLTEADVIEMVITSGKTLQFQVTGRQWVEQDTAPDVFGQTRPGLTLALLGDKGTQRLVVTASYVASLDLTPAAGSDTAQIQTWVQTGEARVMVLDGQLVEDAAGLATGYAYYVVDFSVEALGPNTLDANLFQMDLIDGLGTRYAVSIPASQAGKYGPAGGKLEPGQVLTATAGYLVPETISGPTLTWSFSPRAGAQAPARIQLALKGPAPTPDPRLAVTIQLNTVTYSSDMTEIVVAGGIGNPTDHVVAVDQGDVVLISVTANQSAVSSDPPFPWSVSPGESRAFTLRFPRPAAGSAVLRILQWSFELSGLQ